MKFFLFLIGVSLVSQLCLAQVAFSNDADSPNPNELDGTFDILDHLENLEEIGDEEDQDGRFINLSKPRCYIRTTRQLVNAINTAAIELEKCTQDLTGIPQALQTQIQAITTIANEIRNLLAALERFSLSQIISGGRNIIRNLSRFVLNLSSIIDIVIELDNPDNAVGLQCVKTQVQALRGPIRAFRDC